MEEARSHEFSYAKFNGTTGQYYRIWLVNIILTVLSFGVYSAWAKVRRLKFFLGSIEYNGSYFDFHGDPVAILRGRIILVVLISLYLGISKISPIAVPVSGFIVFLAVPYLFIKSLEFRARYTSFKNLRFSFRGDIKEAYVLWVKYLIFPLLLALVTGYMTADAGFGNTKEITPEQTAKILLALVPYGVAFVYFVFMFHRIFNAVVSFVFNNLYYGETSLSLDSDKDQVLKEIYLKWLKIVFLAFFASAVLIFGLGFISSSLKELIGNIKGVLVVIGFSLSYIIIAVSSLYFNYLNLKYIWSRVGIDSKYQSTFNLSFGNYLFVLISNLIVLGGTFGLAYPWAAVRYQKMLVEARGTDIDNFDNFTGSDQESKSAFGEEISDGLDLGFEFGF